MTYDKSVTPLTEEGAQKKTRLSSSNSSNSSIYGDSPTQRALIIFALLFYSAAYQLSVTIRVGFLADSFSKRGIPGRVYGIVEGCLFVGYVGCFLSRGTEYAMKRVKSKYLLIAILLGSSITTLSTGLIYLVESNTVLVAVSITIRIIQGFIMYPGFLLGMDFVAVRYPKYFDALGGAVVCACYVGHGVAESVGSALYESFGYVAPFVFAAGFCAVAAGLVIIVIPVCSCLMATEEEPGPADNTRGRTGQNRGVTPLIIPPLIATMLINSCYGYLQVTTTPYLSDVHGESLAFGGLVLAVASIGIALGALASGFIVQAEVVRPDTQMTIGAFMVGLGIVVTFPRESMTFLYKYASYVAFPAAFMTGFGDPIMTQATLRCLYQLQEQRRQELTPKQATLITGVWCVSYNAFWFAGATMSGVLTDIFSFPDSADILAGLCVVSLMICVAMKLILKDNKLREETIPLLSAH